MFYIREREEIIRHLASCQVKLREFHQDRKNQEQKKINSRFRASETLSTARQTRAQD